MSGSHSEMQCHTFNKCIPEVTQAVQVYAGAPFIVVFFFCPSELNQNSCSARLHQCHLCSVREVPFAEQRTQPQTSPELS